MSAPPPIVILPDTSPNPPKGRKKLRWRIIVALIGGLLVLLIAILALGVTFLTQTDWGRERVRRIALSALGGSVHGIVKVDRIDGNLLRGITLTGVSITDSAGAPFVTADTLSAHYDLISFVRQRIDLSDVRVVRPVIVLDQPPGGQWNYDRIFPRDTTSVSGEPGFGSWITLRNVELVDGHLTASIPWAPDDTLTRAQQDSVVAYVLGPTARQNVVRVESGFQSVTTLANISGIIANMQVADAKDPRQIFEVATLQMVAQPMRPPPVTVTDLKGQFIIEGDSLYFAGIDAALTESRLHGDGRYNIETGDLRLRLQVPQLSTNDLLWIDPAIPRDGKGSLNFGLDWIGPVSRYHATDTDLKIAGAVLAGNLGLEMDDTIAFYDTDLRFNRLNTRTIVQLAPTVELPVHGLLTGFIRASGGLSAVRLDGDVAFDEVRSGRSRLLVKGIAGADASGFRASGLNVNVAGVQVALMQVIDSTFPLDGIIRGHALLNGSTASRLTIVTDLTHAGSTGDTRLTGQAIYGAGRTPFVNADLALQPLSLYTAGKFVPAAGLRGTVSGPVRLTGPMDSLILDVQLATPDGGAILARGWADWAAAVKTYDVVVHTELFDASQVSTQAPSTSLTADASVRGSGITPDSIEAVATLDLQTSQYDSVTVDSAVVRLRATGGMLHVDTVAFAMPGARASVGGSFGLVDTRTGTLQYDVVIDSLGALSRFLPQDTGVVTPRPAVTAERLKQARADSAQRDRDTEVERAINGTPPPELVVDTPTTVARDRFAGHIRTSGVAEGNLRQYNVRGTVTGNNVVAMGNTVDSVSAQYTAQSVPEGIPHVSASLAAQGVMIAGFMHDKIDATIQHADPDGSASIVIEQDGRRTHRLHARYTLGEKQSTFVLDTVRMQFDSVIYANTRPATIVYGPDGITLDTLNIEAPTGSRIFATADLPKQGNTNLHVNVTQFDVAHIMALLQSDVAASGEVSLDVRARGTPENPSIEGAFGASRLAYNSSPIPEMHGTIAYTDETLRMDMSASREGGAPIIVAKGTIPINLAMAAVEGSRIPTNRQIDIAVDADSLPLHIIPEVTEMVTDMEGEAGAHFTVHGTLDAPEVNGAIALNDASLHLVPTGVTYRDINANIRLLRDTVVIDSIVAHNEGVLRLRGGIGIKSLVEPSFDLALSARDALVLDNEQGRVQILGKLTVKGPFTQVSVDGRVAVMEGVIYVPEITDKTIIAPGDPGVFAVVDTTDPRVRELFPTESPLMANMRVNVGVFVYRDFFVRSRDFNVEVYTDGELRISMDQAKQQLVLDGILLSDRGEYRFQGRRFQVKRGSAIFVNLPELNPTLQLAAEYEVQFPSREAITIRILVGGTLDKPTISLESDAQPPISQTDLLSYLAFGRSSSSLLQMGGNGLTTGGSGSSNLVGQGAALAARQVSAAALGAVSEQVAGQVARAMRADVLYISPADVSLDAGSFLRGTQIEFGKYIQTRTFMGLQFRPDPQSLKRPGFQIVHRWRGRQGYSTEMSFEPRYLPKEPSLSPEQTPATTSVFGLFIVRQWRY